MPAPAKAATRAVRAPITRNAVIRNALIRTTAWTVFLPVAATFAGGALAATGASNTLALKRVMLSTGGVGYFEREARVTGDATLTLEVRRDQVDDVLKSIVVHDDRGGVGTVDLPGPEPLQAAFRELPVTPDDLASPTALLTAMKGAELRVTGARDLSGRLLSVTEENATLKDGATVARHRVGMMTADGLRQFVLEEADSLRFADPALQAKLDRALVAVAGAADKERRRLTIHTTAPRTDPNRERTVRVAYVVAAPLWKATYRLTLPDSGQPANKAASGDLQGWAVLENESGEDWSGVELSVASGNPVTFRQALYSAYFVNRPEVPVEVLGRVLPPPDEGAVSGTADLAEQPMPKAGAMRQERMLAAPAPAAPPMAMAAAPFAPRRPAETVAADSTEATAQVLFRYPQPVTLANGGTLMMPIVARAVPAERLDLYQPATQPRHPLAALRLTNDSAGPDANGKTTGKAAEGNGLPPGVLTLYESVGGATAYVGDARLATLPAGDSRLLSFAVDQGVTVDRGEQPGRSLSRASVADGVLQLTVTDRQTTTYRIAGDARHDRTVIVEHPRRPDWTLVEPAGGPAPDTTETAYRLPVTVPAGKTVTLTATLEHPRVEKVVLSDLAPERLQAYASSAELPEALRKAMGEIATQRAATADKERRVTALERERTGIVQEQERLRDNLKALPNDSDLYKRSLAKMGDQETRLDTLSGEIDAARKEAEAAQAALRERIRGLNL